MRYESVVQVVPVDTGTVFVATATIPETLDSMIRRRDALVEQRGDLQDAAEALAETIRQYDDIITQARNDAINLGAELFAEANKPNPDPDRIRELQDLKRCAEEREAVATEQRRNALSDLGENLRRQQELDGQIADLDVLIRLRGGSLNLE